MHEHDKLPCLFKPIVMSQTLGVWGGRGLLRRIVTTDNLSAGVLTHGQAAHLHAAAL